MKLAIWILGLIAVFNVIGFCVYFFELDTFSIKKLEPFFRKKQNAYRVKKGLE